MTSRLLRQSVPPLRRVPQRGDAAFTLVELSVVVVLMVVLAGIALSAAGEATTQATQAVTRSSLVTVRDAIVGVGGARSSPCFWSDLGRLPRSTATTAGGVVYGLAELLDGRGLPPYDPATRRGWRGPYLLAPGARFGEPDLAAGLPPLLWQWPRYGHRDDLAVLDGHGRPLLLQVPDPDGDGVVTAEDERHARLVSAGEDGVIQIPVASWYPSQASCGDDMVLYLRVADLRP